MTDHTPTTKGWVLAIEVSNPSAAIDDDRPSVAIGLDGPNAPLLATEPVGESVRGSDDLLPAIERARAAARVHLNHLARVAVSVGPGGLTGLRVSVAAAAMIAEARGIPCVGVPTSRVAGVDLPVGTAIALASKADRAWLAIVTDQGVNDIGEVDAACLDDRTILAGGIKALAADDHLPDSWSEKAEALGLDRIRLRLSAERLLRCESGCAPCDPASLAVLYPREAEAVRAWRERHG